MDEHRRALVTDLVHWRQPIRILEEKLAEIPWDPPDDDRVLLGRGAVVDAIDRALRGNVSYDDLERWAHALEMREDVELEDAHRDRLRDTLFDLSNPDVQGPFTPDTLRGLVRRLNA
jgi:hypothetical protein